MGLGMQSWISKMKPRKFLGKRSKADGGGASNNSKFEIEDVYRLPPLKLNWLLQKKYPDNYRKKLNKQIDKEKRKQPVYFLLSFIIALVLLIFLFRFFKISVLLTKCSSTFEK